MATGAWLSNNFYWLICWQMAVDSLVFRYSSWFSQCPIHIPSRKSSRKSLQSLPYLTGFAFFCSSFSDSRSLWLCILPSTCMVVLAVFLKNIGTVKEELFWQLLKQQDRFYQSYGRRGEKLNYRTELNSKYSKDRWGFVASGQNGGGGQWIENY